MMQPTTQSHRTPSAPRRSPWPFAIAGLLLAHVGAGFLVGPKIEQVLKLRRRDGANHVPRLLAVFVEGNLAAICEADEPLTAGAVQRDNLRDVNLARRGWRWPAARRLLLGACRCLEVRGMAVELGVFEGAGIRVVENREVALVDVLSLIHI